jgi:hypothetical protein
MAWRRGASRRLNGALPSLDEWHWLRAAADLDRAYRSVDVLAGGARISEGRASVAAARRIGTSQTVLPQEAWGMATSCGVG